MPTDRSPETARFVRWRATYVVMAGGVAQGFGSTSISLASSAPWPLPAAAWEAMGESVRRVPGLPAGATTFLLSCQPEADDA